MRMTEERFFQEVVFLLVNSEAEASYFPQSNQSIGISTVLLKSTTFTIQKHTQVF